jgi:hypothetical protein
MSAEFPQATLPLPREKWLDALLFAQGHLWRTAADLEASAASTRAALRYLDLAIAALWHAEEAGHD